MEPEILESKVKWALGFLADNKAAGIDEIPIELFKILQDDAVKILLALCYSKALPVWITTTCGKFLKRVPDHLIRLLRNLYVDQKATVRTKHRTTEWFKIRKEVRQGCILSPYLSNLYAEYIIRKAVLDESKAGINIAGRNINNLRYADDTTLMAESEEELKDLLMRVKEESAKAGFLLKVKKTKIMANSNFSSWQKDGEEVEAVTDFTFLGSNISSDGDCSQASGEESYGKLGQIGKN
ncbi:Hypothetical predicted protein [Pelobates cultripes]|uniref:Reverse transcriptase domain-containing protein n=1 Tax=Pelobates cultripes TaxID=61616 RepID=A0AAD1WN55_PELCU|nr:Hypothetical predicted protein [Pelobates cultripes]